MMTMTNTAKHCLTKINLIKYRNDIHCNENRLCGRPPQYAPAPCKLTFDLLTLNVVSESRVTPATSMLILFFLGLSVLDLGPMYATDRQTSDAHHRLMPPPYGGGGIINIKRR